MTDKDLPVGISELLRKQDQQAEILDLHTKLISQTNERLQVLTDVSIKEFEWQHKQAEIQEAFNEKFLSALERQQIFNERFLDKLDEISNKL
ncbi:hypothetical protein BEL04_19675 [Mucilaginibacter sp. PPCGB 2223]|uniref:hypothetical protein n=1 Tax=Mucilaginibacter sp. PPCGB 2223 TaxID=1886027 RepID=UPI000823FBE0|nr:hypothetical protein [Mucilaginibacter sp. PPCGB 2223]OCX50942.1 hypothetical protein BEL04_19675 [Mucilaginibacter sp. PPCGB 2223]